MHKFFEMERKEGASLVVESTNLTERSGFAPPTLDFGGVSLSTVDESGEHRIQKRVVCILELHPRWYGMYFVHLAFNHIYLGISSCIIGLNAQERNGSSGGLSLDFSVRKMAR